MTPVRVGHLVAEQGVSGDMLASVLVDAGAPLDELQQAVDALDVGPVTLERTDVRSGGLRAQAVRARPQGETRRLPTLGDVERVLARAGLPEPVATDALAVMRRLAEAEAEVHDVATSDVVFHELGDVDTVVEVVAACAALRRLGIDELTCGPVAVGGGITASDHGPLPVPPPAVVGLLRGFTIHGGGGARELTTPTGAALVSTLAEPVDGVPRMRLGAQARGVSSPPPSSSRERSVLVLLSGERARAPKAQEAVLLEATVDDLSPELVPVTLDRLREQGAHDAWAVPALMKKGRPGYTLTALADPQAVDALASVLFAESTTLGMRVSQVSKLALPRRWVDVDVHGQTVSVKVAEFDGHCTVTAELEDARVAARALNRSVRAVQELAVAAARSRLAEEDPPGVG